MNFDNWRILLTKKNNDPFPIYYRSEEIDCDRVVEKNVV